MKVILTGGGTMGPVTPLLAVVEAWRAKDASVEFLWIGTPNGPERELVERYKIPFVSIPVARIPRYVSIEWLTFPFVFVAACVQAFRHVTAFKPDLIASAGGYTSVPVVFVGWLKRIPSWLHQQDVEPLITSRVLAPIVDFITVTFAKTLPVFPSQKTKQVGNPVRASLFGGSKAQGVNQFALDPAKPTILVIGGGGGSTWMNQTLSAIASDLLEHVNIIHVTGKGKSGVQGLSSGYYQAPFLSEDMKHAYASADLVVSRAGMGAITELAALSKPSILVPLPKSIQEQNVEALGDAVRVMTQDQESRVLLQMITELLADTAQRATLAKAIHASVQTDHVAEELVVLLEDLLKKKHTR